MKKKEDQILFVSTLHFHWKLQESDPNANIISKYVFVALGRGSDIQPLADEQLLILVILVLVLELFPYWALKSHIHHLLGAHSKGGRLLFVANSSRFFSHSSAPPTAPASFSSTGTCWLAGFQGGSVRSQTSNLTHLYLRSRWSSFLIHSTEHKRRQSSFTWRQNTQNDQKPFSKQFRRWTA